MPVSVKERILTIRLMEKIQADPAYADTLGIKTVPGKLQSNGAKENV